MKPSRFWAALSACLSQVPFKSDRTFPAQYWISATGIIKPFDVFKDRHLSLPVGVTDVPPDQFCLDGFEECFNRSIILEIFRSTDRRLTRVGAGSSGSRESNFGCYSRWNRCLPWPVPRMRGSSTTSGLLEEDHSQIQSALLAQCWTCDCCLPSTCVCEF